mmetsp:Transcript_33416/g.72912  ORF Transcript_33416/g.72912 Transcript_33416/m.72912 type:complete len:329 (+) Transcript_33416:209-1195(+)
MSSINGSSSSSRSNIQMRLKPKTALFSEGMARRSSLGRQRYRHPSLAHSSSPERPFSPPVGVMLAAPYTTYRPPRRRRFQPGSNISPRTASMTTAKPSVSPIASSAPASWRSNSAATLDRGRTSSCSLRRCGYRSSTSSSFCGDPTVPTGTAPTFSQMASACSPHPPEAECTSTVEPLRRSPSAFIPYQTVMLFTMKAAPSLKLQLAGSLRTRYSATFRWLLYAPNRVTPITRSPTFRERVQFSPTSSTTPLNSNPGIKFVDDEAPYNPRQVKTSAKFRPIERTDTRISSGRGAGRSSLTSARHSILPALSPFQTCLPTPLPAILTVA